MVNKRRACPKADSSLFYAIYFLYDALTPSTSVTMYSSVVLMLLWPSSARISRISMPLLARPVAKVLRKRCGCTFVTQYSRLQQIQDDPCARCGVHSESLSQCHLSKRHLCCLCDTLGDAPVFRQERLPCSQVELCLG